MWKEYKPLSGMTDLWAAPERRHRGPMRPDSFRSLVAWDFYSFGLLVWFVMTGGTEPSEATLQALRSGDQHLGPRLDKSLGDWPSEDGLIGTTEVQSVITSLCQVDLDKEEFLPSYGYVGRP